jgi:hypothetical protein
MIFIETIPLRNDVFLYNFKISLSGILYTFTLRFNGRMNRWILNIDDVAGNPLLHGIVLLVNRNLLSQYPTLNLMDGLLAAVDSTNKFVEPTQFSFGNNNYLAYIS